MKANKAAIADHLLTTLAIRVESADPKDWRALRTLAKDIYRALNELPDLVTGGYGWQEDDSGWWCETGEDQRCPRKRIDPPNWLGSIDAAITLLPVTAVNHDLFSFGGDRQPSWGFRFHDTAQLMGERAAKEEIARLRKSTALGSRLRGESVVVLEKAIAEHYLEFYCQSAASAALAIAAAALRSLAPPTLTLAEITRLNQQVRG